MIYYNEIDPKAAAWLHELMFDGHIPWGDVDTRSITEIQPHELTKYTQCHFFAGIGGWAYALALAAWPDDRPVWTGSCPCQPFSVAGKGKGVEDERHLWPTWLNLIRECRPPIIFGEQVASAQVIGRSSKPTKHAFKKSVAEVWIDRVFADLESSRYTCAAADIPAAGVGAPHIRQRLFWCAAGRLGEPDRAGREQGRRAAEAARHGNPAEPASDLRGVGDASSQGLQEQECDGRIQSETVEPHPREAVECGGNAWDSFGLLPCTDGKTRRIPAQSAFFPLVDGVSPGRVGLLRGAGNAIVPQVAQAFIEAYQDLNP